jgi:hypothetical protein
MLYTEEDLKKAFEAGSNMTYRDLAEYEGVYDGEPISYDSFETWFKQFTHEYTKDIRKLY